MRIQRYVVIERKYKSLFLQNHFHITHDIKFVVFLIFILYQVLMVTGGFDGSNLLNTTEVMRIDAIESGGYVWKTVSGKLPTGIAGHHARTISNKVLMFGKYFRFSRMDFFIL